MDDDDREKKKKSYTDPRISSSALCQGLLLHKGQKCLQTAVFLSQSSLCCSQSNLFPFLRGLTLTENKQRHSLYLWFPDISLVTSAC